MIRKIINSDGTLEFGEEDMNSDELYHVITGTDSSSSLLKQPDQLNISYHQNNDSDMSNPMSENHDMHGNHHKTNETDNEIQTQRYQLQQQQKQGLLQVQELGHVQQHELSQGQAHGLGGAVGLGIGTGLGLSQIQGQSQTQLQGQSLGQGQGQGQSVSQNVGQGQGQGQGVGQGQGQRLEQQHDLVLQQQIL